MSSRSLPGPVLIAGLAALLLTPPQSTQAQGLIDFLWGGSSEWGGSRQVVNFDAKYTPGQIIVSFGDRRLYLIARKGQAISYPIAVPREQSRWQGTTSVSAKKENPSWRPTPDMLKENPKLPSWVPGGHPMNPLGVRALYLGASTYRIHGTDAPWTIGQAVSKGCIRMTNEDVLDLYPRTPVGMRVTVTWQRFSDQASVAANTEEPPYALTATASPGVSRRSVPVRNLPPLPRKSTGESANDGLPEDFVVIDDNGRPVAREKAALEPAKVKEPTEAKPTRKPDTAKKPEPEAKSPAAAAKPDKANEPAKAAEKPAATAKAAVSEPAAAGTADADATARKATEAAERAAAAAREAAKAAEAAKKAAEDAQKASSDKEPAKAPGKSATL